MDKLILDPVSISRLEVIGKPVEVCDSTGRPLGIFTPAQAIPFTEADLDRFANEPGGRPLAAILADLENRA